LISRRRGSVGVSRLELDVDEAGKAEQGNRRSRHVEDGSIDFQLLDPPPLAARDADHQAALVAHTVEAPFWAGQIFHHEQADGAGRGGDGLAHEARGDAAPIAAHQRVEQAIALVQAPEAGAEHTLAGLDADGEGAGGKLRAGRVELLRAGDRAGPGHGEPRRQRAVVEQALVGNLRHRPGLRGEDHAGGRGEQMEVRADGVLPALHKEQVHPQIGAAPGAPGGIFGGTRRGAAVDGRFKEAEVGGFQHRRLEIGMRGEQLQVLDARRGTALADQQDRVANDRIALVEPDGGHVR